MHRRAFALAAAFVSRSRPHARHPHPRPAKLPPSARGDAHPPRLPFPHRRGDAGVAARLSHGRRAVRASRCWCCTAPAGSRRQHAVARLRGPALRARPAARRDEVLHHHSGCARPREIGEALGRAARRNSRATTTTTWCRRSTAWSPRAWASSALRLVIGNSMGGMHAWIWGTTLSGFHGCAGADGGAADRDGGAQLDAAADDASRPSATIPDMTDGNYTTQPRVLKFAIVFYGIATNGGTSPTRRQAPTRRAADALVDARLKPRRSRPTPTISSTPWDSSRDLRPGARTWRRSRRALLADQRGRRRAQPARDRRHRSRA